MSKSGTELLIASRYAKALFQVALQENLLTKVEDDLKLLVDAFSHQQLQELMCSPVVNVQAKKEILYHMFKELAEVSLKFMAVLLDAHRESNLNHIFSDYKRLVRESLGVMEAEVKTPFVLTDEQKQQIAEVFEPLVGKKLELTETIDTDLLGGIVLSAGDRRYDSSLKRKLERFKEKITG